MRCRPLIGTDGKAFGFACGSGRAADAAPRYAYPSPCPYCGARVLERSSMVVYGLARDYGPMYICSNYPACDAYVGCHPGTNRPLGRLADLKLREAKQAAHDAFDPLWRRKMERDGCSKGQARTAAYAWLSKVTGIVPEKCHIGMFDELECRAVLNACAPYQRS